VRILSEGPTEAGHETNLWTLKRIREVIGREFGVCYAAELGTHVAFVDETGFLLVPTTARTWAPKEKTPVLLTADSWTKVSAISIMTVSPRCRRRGLHCQFHPNKNIRAGQVAECLDRLLHHLRGHIVLSWDRGLSHRAKCVGRFLQKHP